MKLSFRLLFVLAFIAAPLRAQDISGDWQGTLMVPAQGNQPKTDLRVVVKIAKEPDGGWSAVDYSIDQSSAGMNGSDVKLEGNTFKYAIPGIGGSYEGKLSADGNSIIGTWSQGGDLPLILIRATKETAWPHDIHCSCSISFMQAERGVKLEVLDWGGTGRPLVLLAGLGATAHDFDSFAQKLAGHYHVYGITRRGYGDSSSPSPTDANYNADRLGADVLAIMDSLHLKERPVLIGHSIAGEELSSVGTLHPERVAGLIYLDAAYGYAFYNPAYPDPDLDVLAIRKKLDETITGDKEKALSELLAELPDFEKKLQAQKKEWAGVPADPPDSSGDFGPDEAIMFGQRKYTKIEVPVLAIFASPHKLDPMPEYDAAGRAAVARTMQDHTTTAIKALETGVSSAHVVIIPNADHFVYQSNEADVLREVNAFLAKLPQ